MNKEHNCTFSDKELVERVNEIVSKLCKTGGKSWSLRVPVDFNNDPDVLIIEMGQRLLLQSKGPKIVEGNIICSGGIFYGGGSPNEKDLYVDGNIFITGEIKEHSKKISELLTFYREQIEVCKKSISEDPNDEVYNTAKELQIDCYSGIIGDLKSLETKEEEYKKALKGVEKLCNNQDSTHEEIWRVVYNVLNSKK